MPLISRNIGITGVSYHDLAFLYFDEILSSTSKKIATAMPKEAEPSTTEKSYILRALSEGVRLDARSLDATREIEIKFGNDLGVVNLRLGLTRYIGLV